MIQDSQRRGWACPDLGAVKDAGLYLPIPGSKEEFPECPAYYLRSGGDGLPAIHLIDDALHPAALVSEWYAELETGARMAADLPPRGRELVGVMRREKASKWEHDQEERKRGARH